MSAAQIVKKMNLWRWICKSRGMRNVRCLSSVSAGSRPRWIPVVKSGAAELVGYSHGWGALFDKRNHDLFLLHPVTGEEVKLPRYDTLPDLGVNLDLDGHGSVSKVILSDNHNRAMMTFGPLNRLAFCAPGRSSKWTPLGDPYFEYDVHDRHLWIPREHEDLVFCNDRGDDRGCHGGLLASISACKLQLHKFIKGDSFFPCSRLEGYMEYPEVYDWEINNPDKPKLVKTWPILLQQNESRTLLWVEENIELLATECMQIPHLVYARDQLFLVMRFVRLLMRDGSPLGCVPLCDIRGGLLAPFVGKTFGFIVFDTATGEMVDHLDGITMFLGINHSQAFCDPRFFDPDTIYFTDPKRITDLCCVNDTGVFNYATKTFST